MTSDVAYAAFPAGEFGGHSNPSQSRESGMLTCRLWVTWAQVLSYLLSRLHGLHLLITAEVKAPIYIHSPHPHSLIHDPLFAIPTHTVITHLYLLHSGHSCILLS